MSQLNTCQLNIADVFPQPTTPDGNITASDALCIFQKALGLPSCLDIIPLVSAGGDHTCRILDTGAVACWGFDDDGQSAPPAGTFTTVSAGADHTCGILDTGAVACWGLDDDGQSTPPAGTFAMVSAGGDHTCGILDTGAVACWGLDDDGQSTPPAGTFAMVSAGGDHTCGILGTGAVACWGLDDDGQSVPSARATTPNLEVGSPTVDDTTPETGESFTLSATVSNQGDGESAATTLRYYRSTDATITTSDTEAGTDAVAGLAALGSGSVSISLTAPSTAGTYYYGACVDTVTGESDTTNNCSSSVTVTVAEPQTSPDLLVGSPTVNDSSLETGAAFALSATVSNQGDGESAATTLHYYRSTDAMITTSDTSVGTDAVGTLAASGTSAESISLTAPSTAGTYYYGACVRAIAF